MKVIAIPEYCLGCALCEIYCAAEHDGYQGQVLKAFKKGQPEPRSLLLVNGPVSRLNTCRHCDDAPCLHGCISGAIKRDEEGIIHIDEQRCVLAILCYACPYGYTILPPERKNHW